MRAVIQRVSRASVSVDDKVVGQIDRGLVILLGIGSNDTDKDLLWLAEKCINLRIFENTQGKFHNSLLDINGEALIISQFTLFGDCRRGRRPSFTNAADPEKAESMYAQFVEWFIEQGIQTQKGIFAAHMKVDIQNMGPVTIMLDSDDR